MGLWKIKSYFFNVRFFGGAGVREFTQYLQVTVPWCICILVKRKGKQIYNINTLSQKNIVLNTFGETFYTLKLFAPFL